MTNYNFGAPDQGRAPTKICPSTGEAVTVLVLIASIFAVLGFFIGWLVFSTPSADFSGRNGMSPWDRTALAAEEAGQ